MKVFTVFNRKGGTSKSTTTVNLSASLADKGKRVLVIDLDPQATSSHWLGFTEKERGLFDVFAENGNLRSLVCDTNVTNLSIVPSSPWLVNIEKALAGEIGAEGILKSQIDKLKDWDYVFIDCPSSANILSVNALVSAKAVMVPLELNTLSLEGLVYINQAVSAVKERLNSKLEIEAIIPSRVRKTKLAEEILEKLKGRFKEKVYQTRIRENVRLSECPSFQIPITQYDPKSAGAQDFKKLAQEFLKRQK